jgi:hypothetical protein
MPMRFNYNYFLQILFDWKIRTTISGKNIYNDNWSFMALLNLKT